MLSPKSVVLNSLKNINQFHNYKSTSCIQLNPPLTKIKMEILSKLNIYLSEQQYYHIRRASSKLHKKFQIT